MSETNISNEIALAISRESGGRIITWRNNTGVAIAITPPPKGSWYKLCQMVTQFVKKLGGGASPIKYGLCEGSSDRIGIVPVLISPKHIGMVMGVFLALEVKTSTGRATEEQENFIQAVRRAGGMAGVVRSVDEAIAVCNPLLPCEK